MVPNEDHQYSGIIQLLQYFGWTWIGLMALDNNNGEKFLETLELLLSQNGICTAYTERIPYEISLDNLEPIIDKASSIHVPLTDQKVNTFIIYGESVTIARLRAILFVQDPTNKEKDSFRKVWVMTSGIDFMLSGLQRGWDLDLFQGAISFTVHSRELKGFKTFLQMVDPSWAQEDGFFKDFWEQAFDCFLPNPDMSVKHDEICSGKERLEDLPEHLFEMHTIGHSYSIYNGVYATVHALHAMFSSKSLQTCIKKDKSVVFVELQPWLVMALKMGLFLFE